MKTLILILAVGFSTVALGAVTKAEKEMVEVTKMSNHAANDSLNCPDAAAELARKKEELAELKEKQEEAQRLQPIKSVKEA